MAVAITAGFAVTGVAVAGSADAATAQYKLNGVDASFLRSNEQVNLAEITLGGIELRRATGPAAINLARTTVADHRTTRAANMRVARKVGINEPTVPNAMQQRAANYLKHAPRVNREYFVLQIAGHKESIAQTQNEIANGRRLRVLAYARYYLPIAQSHLRMAQRDLSRWDRQH